MTLPQALDDLLLVPLQTRCARRPSLAKMWAFVVGPLFPEKAVGVFMEGTFTYTLSKIWHDLITIELLGLTPPSFCTAKYDHCDPAGFGAKLLYAVALLPLAALLRHVAVEPSLQWVPSIDSIPTMVSMLAGWGLGDACIALITELREGPFAGLCAPPPFDGAAPDCTYLDMLLASLLTLLASVTLVYVQPLMHEIQLGDGRIVDRIENWLEATWQLLSKALATSVMVVWTFVFSAMVLMGAKPAEQTSVTRHLLVFWAISITLMGSLVAVRCERWEQELATQLDRAERRAAESRERESGGRPSRASAPAPSAPVSPQLSRVSTPRPAPVLSRQSSVKLPPPTEAVAAAAAAAHEAATASAAESLARSMQAELEELKQELEQEARENVAKLDNLTGHYSLSTDYDAFDPLRATVAVTKVRAMVEFSNLVQGTLGWVAGCAWTDVATNLFPTLSAPPSVVVLLANVLVALALSAAAVLWLVVTGEDPNTVPWDSLLKREDVEQYFITGAASFFVGWAWVLVVRDVFLPIGDAFGALAQLFGTLVGLYRLDDAEDMHRARRAGEMLSAATFAPLLTCGFFVLKHRTREAYRQAVGLRVSRRWVHVAGRSHSSEAMSRFLSLAQMQAVVVKAVQQSGGDTAALLADQDSPARGRGGCRASSADEGSPMHAHMGTYEA